MTSQKTKRPQLLTSAHNATQSPNAQKCKTLSTVPRRHQAPSTVEIGSGCDESPSIILFVVWLWMRQEHQAPVMLCPAYGASKTQLLVRISRQVTETRRTELRRAELWEPLLPGNVSGEKLALELACGTCHNALLW